MSYFRDSLYWLYLIFFRPLTFQKEVFRFSWKQSFITFLKIYPIVLVIYSLLFLLVGEGIEILELSFNWKKAIIRFVISLGLGLFIGLTSHLFFTVFISLLVVPIIGLVGGMADGLGFGLGSGLLSASSIGLSFGLVFGLIASEDGLGEGVKAIVIAGLLVGLMFLLGGGLGGTLGIGLASGLTNKRREDYIEIALPEGLTGIFLVGIGGGLVGGVKDGLLLALTFALWFVPITLFLTFRPYYLLPYIWRFASANRRHDAFHTFHNSLLYWGEDIAIPLPRLKDRLVDLVMQDKSRGMQEILFVAENHPYQRKAAFKALLAVTEQDLQLIHDLNGLANAADLLKAFPADGEALPKGLDDARRRLNTISTLAQDYQMRLTPNGQLKVLEELRRELETFRSAMALTAAPVGTTFQPSSSRWLEMVRQVEIEARARLQFNALPNSFVAGNPLRLRDFDLLKGRRDIIRTIEKYILNANQRSSLLLFGRRRAGKSSTLLNLPRLLSSQFEPVYLDCQDAKWHESDQAFCYNLAREIFERLFQSDDVKGIRQPQEAQFEKNAFTRLDEYLDQFERLATERGKRILLAFDEYEGLEESIAGGDISKNILGKLRNIIQHRQRIVVLVSGSHRFEELTGVNWASYLINTRTLELSFLDEPSARELLTEPVPQLQYEDGVLEEILRLTHCQPYLLQAVASELVNHLNELQKTTATRADLDAAVNKVLTSAGAYFANTWREDNSPTEQTVLRAYAEGASERVAAAEFQSAIQSLIRKEMMERDGDTYRLAVPLFGLWILRNQVDGN